MSFSRYPEYKNSGIDWLGEVPKHWLLTALKHMATLNPRKSDFNGDRKLSCSFVPMEKLKTGKITLDERRAIGDVIDGYTYFENGDVLQAKVTPCFENKNVAIAQSLVNGVGFGSSEIDVLRPSSETDSAYLFYRVQEDGYMAICTASMIGAGGLKRVPSDVKNNFKVAIPPSEEQTQIARFLNHETAKIDTLIHEQKRLIELLKEKRQAVISHAVTKGLDPDVPMKDSGVEWLGEVPAHWSVRKVSYDFTAAKGSRGAILTKEYCASNLGPYPVYSGQTGNEGILGSINDFDFSLGSNGGLLTTTVGAKAMSINFIQGNVSLSQNCMLIRPISKNVYIKFFFYHLQPLFRLERRMIPDHMQPSFRMEDLFAFYVAIPPVQEQQEIAHDLDLEINKFMDLENEGGQLIKHLKERRSALISAAVTGKIDVRDWQPPADESAFEEEVRQAGMETTA